MKQKKRAGRLSFFALLSNFRRKFERFYLKENREVLFFALLSNFRRKFERFYLKESREALFFCATSEFPKGNLEGSFLSDRFHDRACCLRLVHGINMDAVCTVLL